ncbi:hypothetical protein CI109_104142 [Kwoniella shandongensis]|uniref:Nucleolar complex-associated protein 3 n=1 Tax=Kwoniella shandongensis TaxID=1734106 RepID=A0A5M6C5N0_9TREE|nr:uncharacterized protein CI109_002945 [Kwoniella shandongensis]KAA5528785.1 hypothetical protein CI109_002945 [Kwoniella shandongensis]
MGKPAGRALGKRKAPAGPSKPNAKKSRPGQGASSSSSASKTKTTEQETGPTGKPKRKADQPKKIKLRDQKIIPVPKSSFAKSDRNGHGADGSDDEDEDEDDDMMDDLGEEEGLDVASAGRFLLGVDANALSRSTKETKRLHELSKNREQMPKQQRAKSGIPIPPSASGSSDYEFDSDLGFDSDLQSDYGSDEDGQGSVSGSEPYDSGASLDDSDEDDSEQGDLNAAFDEDDLPDGNVEGEEFEPRHRKKKEEEADYEMAGRARWAAKALAAKNGEEEHVEVGRLPIKLPTGEIKMVEGSTRIALPPSKKKVVQPESESEEEQEESEDEGSDDGAQAEKMAGQKGKFGRMGVAEIVGNKGWKNAQKLEAAKEQMAALGAEILAGGELVDIGPVLTRLSTFALRSVPSVGEVEELLPVPASIRGLAFLSQLAVFKDLIPGYRIRQLTEAEEKEKVRDEVKRLREGEKLLVRSYKGYLKMLEAEVKGRTPLAGLSMRCMAELLTSVTHFNFSENIMGVLVGRLGRRSWDQDSDLVLQSFISVFRADLAGTHSQTLVRLIARMIKERHFQVHPNVLFCLLHLRLRDELDRMRKGKNAKGKRDDGGKKDDPLKGKQFKSDIRKKWATKNQRKKEKELKEVQKEMAEASAEVDKEETAQVQTETLKNLFVLYFSILKSPTRTPLLPAALEGISTYAHHINVDFFRDLLIVLRRIISDQETAETKANEPDSDDEDEENRRNQVADPVGASQRVRLRLLAIVTAFDLLSGQGEALNIDLADFINSLFTLLRPLSLDTGIEDPPTLPPLTKLTSNAVHTLSTSGLLFRCLNSTFFSPRNVSKSPPYRTAAFAKRLVECALQFPPESARQAINFARALMSKEAKLEGMLDTEERMADGVYKPEMEDPQLCNPFATSLWEGGVLGDKHWDRLVRTEMVKYRDGKVV